MLPLQTSFAAPCRSQVPLTLYKYFFLFPFRLSKTLYLSLQAMFVSVALHYVQRTDIVI